MGLLYDTYRVMKGQTGLRGWLVIICDLLFWASCTFLVFGTLMRVNEGIVRMYLFLAMGAGVWLYFILLHSYYIKWFLTLIRWVKATYRFIMHLIHVLMIKPLFFLYKLIIATIIAFALFLWKVILFIYRILQSMIMPPVKWTGKSSQKIYSSSKKKGAGFLRRIAKLIRTKWKKKP